MTHSLSPPSRAQLALALAIVKLKPTGQSVKEHILQIRLYIVNGKARDVDLIKESSCDSHFDSVKFWQEAYEKAENAKSRLFDKIHNLEQRNEGLLYRIKSLKHANESDMEYDEVSYTSHSEIMRHSRMDGNKVDGRIFNHRKATVPLRACVNAHIRGDRPIRTQAKKRKRDESPHPVNFDCPDVLARQIFVLRATMSKRQNHAGLTLSTIELCKAIENAIQPFSDTTITETRKNGNVSGTSHPSLQAVYFTAQSAFQLLYQALHKLATSTNGTRYQGQIIYQFVSLFEGIMKMVESRCKSLATHEAPQIPKKSRGRPKKGQEVAHSFPPERIRSIDIPTLGSCENLEADVLWHTTSLLETMIVSLDMRYLHNTSVMEGYMYVLISRVGQLLSLLHFDSSEHIEALRNGASDSDNPAAPLGCSDGVAVLAVELETTCLVWALEKALEVSGESSTFSHEHSCGGKVLLGPLQKLAHHRLQNTLLKAIFCEENEIFGSSLTKPQRPRSKLPRKLHSAIDLREWFTQEVWRLIGWDILDDVLKTKFAESTVTSQDSNLRATLT